MGGVWALLTSAGLAHMSAVSWGAAGAGWLMMATSGPWDDWSLSS